MTTTTLHPLATDYVDRLRRSGRRLPRQTLRELVADIEAHMSEATAPEMSDAEVLTVLDRLGPPEEIVAAQQLPPEGHARGTREWAAIVLLLFGGFVFGVGWLAGLILLWSSRAWTTIDKWIGTLVIPGGLLAGLLALGVGAQTSITSCSGGGGGPAHCASSGGGVNLPVTVLVAVIALSPFLTAVYLARRAR